MCMEYNFHFWDLYRWVLCDQRYNGNSQRDAKRTRGSTHNILMGDLRLYTQDHRVSKVLLDSYNSSLFPNINILFYKPLK